MAHSMVQFVVHIEKHHMIHFMVLSAIHSVVHFMIHFMVLSAIHFVDHGGSGSFVDHYDSLWFTLWAILRISPWII